MTGLLILGGLILVGAIILTVIGLRNPELANERALQARLEEFSLSGEELDRRMRSIPSPASSS